MADGDILRGKTHFPLYGKDGTLLYETPIEINMGVTIEISPMDGRYLTFIAFYTGLPPRMGELAGGAISWYGFQAKWTTIGAAGESDFLRIWYDKEQEEEDSPLRTFANEHFEIHLNWYSYGYDEHGHQITTGGPARVTATDDAGNTASIVVRPGNRIINAATENDPGVKLNFNKDGTLQSITAI